MLSNGTEAFVKGQERRRRRRTDDLRAANARRVCRTDASERLAEAEPLELRQHDRAVLAPRDRAELRHARREPDDRALASSAAAASVGVGVGVVHRRRTSERASGRASERNERKSAAEHEGRQEKDDCSASTLQARHAPHHTRSREACSEGAQAL